MTSKLPGLNSNSYLTKGLLKKLFGPDINNNKINELILNGDIIRHFSYYKPTEQLLRKLKIIPSTVIIDNNYYGDLAKHNAFTLRKISEIFSHSHIDTTKVIAKKYFYRKYNYYYKNDLLNNLLSEGHEELEI